MNALPTLTEVTNVIGYLLHALLPPLFGVMIAITVLAIRSLRNW